MDQHVQFELKLDLVGVFDLVLLLRLLMRRLMEVVWILKLVGEQPLLLQKEQLLVE